MSILYSTQKHCNIHGAPSDLQKFGLHQSGPTPKLNEKIFRAAVLLSSIYFQDRLLLKYMDVYTYLSGGDKVVCFE